MWFDFFSTQSDKKKIDDESSSWVCWMVGCLKCKHKNCVFIVQSPLRIIAVYGKSSLGSTWWSDYQHASSTCNYNLWCDFYYHNHVNVIFHVGNILANILCGFAKQGFDCTDMVAFDMIPGLLRYLLGMKSAKITKVKLSKVTKF